MAAMLAAALLLAFAAPARAMDFAEARHLLNRTGFGASPRELARFAELDYEAAVDALLDGARREPLTPAPRWVHEPPPDPRLRKGLSREERKRWRELLRERGLELKAWWYRELLETDSPLTERMTLFWHNHFTSDLRKARWPGLMHAQNRLLRRHALGDYRALLHAIARDPAMVLYLDSQSNRKGKPNENFARELLELFTLGEGHYTEADIQEAARAFTGWGIERRTGRFRFRPERHDDGPKTFLGSTGRFGGDELIDRILARPRAGEFIVEKLWREFVSLEEPDPGEVRRLAALFRDGGYQLEPLLRALLLSPAFRDPKRRGTLVKSPVDLLVGTLRTFSVPVADARPLAMAGRRLGQDLLDPPNVKGWAGGIAWISSDSLLARQAVLRRFLRGREMGRRGRREGRGRMGGDTDPAAALGGGIPRERLIGLLLPVPPAGELPEGADAARLARALVLDPAYQLR